MTYMESSVDLNQVPRVVDFFTVLVRLEFRLCPAVYCTNTIRLKGYFLHNSGIIVIPRRRDSFPSFILLSFLLWTTAEVMYDQDVKEQSRDRPGSGLALKTKQQSFLWPCQVDMDHGRRWTFPLHHWNAKLVRQILSGYLSLFFSFDKDRE